MTLCGLQFSFFSNETIQFSCSLKGGGLVSKELLCCIDGKVKHQIEITSWLVSAYDFYARVAENSYKRTSEFIGIVRNECMIKILQANQPLSNLFIILVLRYYECLTLNHSQLTTKDKGVANSISLLFRPNHCCQDA